MSTQSIHTNNIETLFKEVESTIKKNTKDLVLQESFALGKGMCKEAQKHNLKLYEIMLKDNCDLNDYLLKIIKTGPDCELVIDTSITGDGETSQPPEDLYQIWIMRGNKGSYEDFLDVIFNVNVDVWDTNEW